MYMFLCPKIWKKINGINLINLVFYWMVVCYPMGKFKLFSMIPVSSTPFSTVICVGPLIILCSSPYGLQALIPLCCLSLLPRSSHLLLLSAQDALPVLFSWMVFTVYLHVLEVHNLIFGLIHIVKILPQSMSVSISQRTLPVFQMWLGILILIPRVLYPK